MTIGIDFRNIFDKNGYSGISRQRFPASRFRYAYTISFEFTLDGDQNAILIVRPP